MSPDHVQPLESSNYKFEPSKNNVLLSLRPMDENFWRHEQVSNVSYYSTAYLCIDYTDSEHFSNQKQKRKPISEAGIFL